LEIVRSKFIICLWILNFFENVALF
jgi:hypothetical protein